MTPNEIGRLEMQDNGKIIFKGDADASAEILFDFIVSCNVVSIKRYRRALERISCASTDVYILLWFAGALFGAMAPL